MSKKLTVAALVITDFLSWEAGLYRAKTKTLLKNISPTSVRPASTTDAKQSPCFEL